MKLLKSLIRFKKTLKDCNKELSKVIGKKSVYGKIELDEVELLYRGWISFFFSEKLTEKEKKKVLQILEKYFGKLDRPQIIQHFKTEKGKYGLRWNTYEFFSYLPDKSKKLLKVLRNEK